MATASKKRPRDDDVRSIQDVELSAHDPQRAWRCDSDVLKGEGPEILAAVHPLKASYMHFVVVPRRRGVVPGAGGSGGDGGAGLSASHASVVSALHEAGRALAAKYSTAGACAKFLAKHRGRYGPDDRIGARRWAGKKEVANLQRVYGTGEGGGEKDEVPYVMGFEAFTPALNELHLHVMSRDFAYVSTQADWNRYATEWGLLSPDSLKMVLEGGLDVSFPDADEMEAKCRQEKMKDYHTGLLCEKVRAARQVSLSGLLGRTVELKEDEEDAKAERNAKMKEEAERQAAEAFAHQEKAAAAAAAAAGGGGGGGATRSVALKAGDFRLLAPVRPKAKVKMDVKESVVSAFKKWADYFFHLKYLKMDDDDGVAEATQAMRDLSCAPCIGKEDKTNLNALQARARERYFEGVHNPHEDENRRKAKFDGHEIVFGGGENDLDEPTHDVERCPF